MKAGILQKEKALCKYNLFSALTSPSFYILAVLYAVLVPLNFFIRHQFFTSGTTSLTLFFSDVPYICIIAVPALCYRQSYSVYEDFVPLRHIRIIFARFFSILIQFCLMNLLLLPSVLLVNLFGSTDAAQILTSFIILLCYGAAVIALCLCMGELTSRISAFVLSALLLAAINSAHLFAVYVSLGGFLTGLFKQMSFAWHFDAAGKGVFDSRDFIWLAGSCFIFIFLADFISRIKRGRLFVAADFLRSLGILLAVFLVMMNGSRWYFRADFSQGRSFSLSDYSKTLISKLDSPVKITYFRSQSLSRLYPQVRDVSDFLSMYASSSRKLSLVIKNPDKDEASAALLQNYGIQSQQFRSVSGSSTEYTNVYSAIIIEYQGNAEVIPFTMDALTLEYDIDGRLKHLLSGSRRFVNLVAGNGMSIYDDYSYLVPWLSSQGFECKVLDWQEADFSKELLSSSGPLLVLGDGELPVEAAIAIEDYILSEKGNALLAISPYSAAIDDNWYISQNKRTNLVEMVENWGVSFLPEIAADISCARITMYSDDNSETQVLNYPMWLSLLPQENARAGANLFWATPLSLSGAQNGGVEPFLVTSPAAYSYEIDTRSPQKEKLVENNPFLLAEDASVAQKERMTLTVGARLSGGLEGLFNLSRSKNATVIVIPDPYFVNTLMQQYLGQENDFRNFNLLTDILLSLNGEEELAQLHSRGQRDSSLYKVTDAVQLASKRRLLFLVIFALIPLIITVTGIFACLRLLRPIKGGRE